MLFSAGGHGRLSRPSVTAWKQIDRQKVKLLRWGGNKLTFRPVCGATAQITPRGRPPVSVYLPYETLTKEEGVLVGGEGFSLPVGGSAEAVVWVLYWTHF